MNPELLRIHEFLLFLLMSALVLGIIGVILMIIAKIMVGKK